MMRRDERDMESSQFRVPMRWTGLDGSSERSTPVLEFDIFFEKGVLLYSLAKGMRVERGKKSRKIELKQVDPQFDSLKDQLENFVDACEGKKKLEVTGEDALRVMRLIDALYRSSKRMVHIE